MNEKLKELYHNPKYGFQSLSKFYHSVKENGIKASFNDVKRFIESQNVYQTMKQVRKPKEFSNVYASKPLESVQIDIRIYDRYQFHGYKYILGVIDVYSRKLACRAMTNRTLAGIMKNLKDIFTHDFKGDPENINCDNEFNKKELIDYCTGKHTKLWFSQPDQPHKNAVIERVWRTLALLLQRMRQETKNFDWIKALPEAVENYNNTYHRVLKATPEQVFEEKKLNPVERKVVESNLKQGDKVRIKTEKKPFQKGDIQTFSKDIYIIIEKQGKMNRLKNLKSKLEGKKLYHDSELDQTFSEPEPEKAGAKPVKKMTLKPVVIKKPSERVRKKREILDL
jgi:hypothetical protein